MSTNICTSPPHLIAILMSAAGRFLVCRGCHLRFDFPSGAHFDVIAKQFEPTLCGSQRLSNDLDLSANTATPYDLNSALNRFDFDHDATPMWVFDIDTLAFSAVNDAAVRHYGYSRKEFLSMTILDILPTEGIAALLREILEKRTLNSTSELRKHRRKDGSVIDVEVTRCELLFNGRIADLVTAVDITGHRGIPSSRHETGTLDV